jgi:hypothetical protein
MANIFGPILPLQLDSRNTEALVRAIQNRIYLESDGQLNDFTPASPLSAIAEGQAFAQAELLYYLNNLPEAFSLQWLKQLGIQRRIGSRALVDVTFFRVPSFNRVITIPPGTKLISSAGLTFITLEAGRMTPSDISITIPCHSDKWGSVYNVGPSTINRLEKNILGVDFITNDEAAQGGRDLESVSEMKVRAFEVLSRRNLTTAQDFENEISTLVADTAILKVLTYEERNNLDQILSGNIVVCVGGEDGTPLSSASKKEIINSLRNRVVLGTNVSLVDPEVTPVEVVIEIYYDPLASSGNIDFYANDVLALLREQISPASIDVGDDLQYQNILRELYTKSYVNSINNFDIKLLVKDATAIEGACAGLSGEETEDGLKCNYDYESVVDQTTPLFDNKSPIRSFNLYRCEITFTSVNDYTPINFVYESLYSL